MRTRSAYLLLVAALAAAAPEAAGSAANALPRNPSQPGPAGESFAQMQLASPAWYAVVLHKPTKTRRLYSRKDVLIHDRQPMRSVTIVRVDPDILVFRQGITKQSRSLPAGNPIPGFPDLLFTETVKLSQLLIRYKQVERITQAEFVLTALEGTKAVLEVEVLRSAGPAGPPPPSAARAARTPELFQGTAVKKTGAHTYEISAEELRPVLEYIGELPLPDFQPIVGRFFAYQAGEGWRLASPVADGLLNPSGFTVTNPKVARYFGIETGDTILRINGYPVTSPLSAYWAYQETIARNPLLSELHVDLNRGGMPVTKTYQIR